MKHSFLRYMLSGEDMAGSEKCRKNGLLLVVFFCAPFYFISSVFCAPDALPGKQNSKKILAVYSYNQGYEWNDGVERGIHEVLKGKDVEFKDFYMDTKRNTGLGFKTAAGKKACELIDTWQPDVVIASDDNAQLFVTQKYVGKKPYFVFCGVNADPKEYGFPASNVTGILQRTPLKAALAYLKEIFPNIRRIAIISDDDPTSIAEAQDMQNEKPDDIEILDFRCIGDFVTWKKRILEYNQKYKDGKIDALCILNYHTIRENPEIPKSMAPKDVMRWTKESCIVPTFGTREFAIADGDLCGVIEFPEEHGREAATYALALLAGADIKTLPIKTAAVGLKMVNLDTAKRLGITVPGNVIHEAEKVFQTESE